MNVLFIVVSKTNHANGLVTFTLELDPGFKTDNLAFRPVNFGNSITLLRMLGTLTLTFEASAPAAELIELSGHYVLNLNPLNN